MARGIISRFIASGLVILVIAAYGTRAQEAETKEPGNESAERPLTVAPYGPNGKLIENAARDTQTLTTVWNTSWKELIGLLDEMGTNHTTRKHWIECEPTTVDFREEDAGHPMRSVGPKLKGFVFRNFTLAHDGRSATARVDGNNKAGQVLATITVDGLAPPQYFNLSSLSYASTAPLRLVGHRKDSAVVRGTESTGSVISLEFTPEWNGVWQLDFTTAEPTTGPVGLSIGRMDAQLCTFRWGKNETFGTPPLPETLRAIGVAPPQLGPAIDPIPQGVQRAVREQARSDLTQAAIIPAALTTGVGIAAGTVADVAARTEIPIPELLDPNPDVPEPVRVATHGLNTALKSAVAVTAPNITSAPTPADRAARRTLDVAPHDPDPQGPALVIPETISPVQNPSPAATADVDADEQTPAAGAEGDKTSEPAMDVTPNVDETHTESAEDDDLDEAFPFDP